MNAEDHEELRIARHANLWLIRLKREGRSSHAPCMAWLRESSRHLEAFLLASALSKCLRELKPWHDVEVVVLPRTEDRVVPLPVIDHSEGVDISSLTGRRGFGLPDRKRSKGWRAAVVTLLIAAVGTSLFVISSSQGAETYATGVGEQRQVKLPDGSFVVLNTDSQVRVVYTAAARDVQLLRGEALFTVEHDLLRPFRVSTGTAVVNAVGTRFDVYRQSARTLIEVVAGEVNVFKDTNSGVPAKSLLAHLTAGDRASIDPQGQVSNNPRNIQRAHNWQERWLVFTEASLAEIAAEVNRYNRAQIVVEGKELNERPLTVDFSADHPEILFEFLHRKDARVIVDKQRDKFVVRFRSKSAG